MKIGVKQSSTSSHNDETQKDQTVSFETMANRMTNQSQRMAEDSPLAEMNEVFKATYSAPIYDTEKGSIKIRVTVKTIESLEMILSDIWSGKLSQICSKILFPNEELPLEITFDGEELESIYAQLKEIHAIKNCGKEINVEQFQDHPFICKV